MLLLHISDIHFRHPECLGIYPDRPFRTLLQNDIRALLRRLSAPLDAILVTGDIAYRAAALEFNAAEAWLDQMALEFGHPRRASVFVVPGNHDVDRGQCRQQIDVRNVQRVIRSCQTIPDMERELRAQLGDAATSHSILKPIETYNDFAAKFDCNLFAPQKIHWTHDLPMDHRVLLRLHGLNSTLLSGYQGENDERGHLYLSAYQTAFNPEEGVVNAVLAHHPPDWCRDNDDIEDAMTSRAQLHFFGHKHRQRITQEDRYVRYSAGAVNPDRHEPGWEPGYNLLQLAIDVRGTERWLVVDSHVRTLRTGDQHFDYRRPGPGIDCHSKAFRIPGHYVRQEEVRLNARPADPVPRPDGMLQDAVVPESVRDRDLVFRFWALTMSQRRDIARALNLLEPGEMQTPEAERYGRALLRAKERGLVDRLSEEITKREGTQ